MFELLGAALFEVATPVAHDCENGFERAAEVGEVVLDAWWDLCEDVARDDAVCFELAKLESDHALGGVGYEAAEFAEAFGAVEEMTDKDRFPSAADDAEGCLDVASCFPVIVACHMAWLQFIQGCPILTFLWVLVKKDLLA